MSKVKEPDLSCPHIGHAEAMLRRIMDWADEYEHFDVEGWAKEAYDEMGVIRSINKQLRRAAFP